MRSISHSELKRWLNCRLRWYWSSAPPRGLGLAPKVDQVALAFGREVHAVLQQGYDTGRPFDEIYNEMAAAYKPKKGILGEDKFEVQLKQGIAILQGYQAWSQRADKVYRFLATESEGSGVEIPGTKGTLSYIFDAVVERHDGLWIMDFKTTKYRNNPWTTQDLQATIYTYAARKLISPDIRGVIFRFILKKAPYTYEDLILKSGKLTTRKNLAELTTYGQYFRALAVATLKEMVEKQGYEFEDLFADEGLTLKGYSDALSEVKDEPEFAENFLAARRLYFDTIQDLKGANGAFFWDVPEYRTETQVAAYMKHVIVPTMNEILNVKWIGPTGLSMAYAACGRCPFKYPCKLAMDGADYRSILAEDFELGDKYRKELEDEANNT